MEKLLSSCKHVFIAVQLLVFFSQVCSAVATNEIGIEIIDYGLFKNEEVGAAPNIGSPTGQFAVGDANVPRLVRKTDSIPAVIGNDFGVRYRVAGPVPGEKVMLTTKVRTPGLRKATVHGQERREEPLVYEEKLSGQKTVGEVAYDGFLFENDWELVSGTWTIQIYLDDRMLGEHNFNVHAEKERMNAGISGKAEKNNALPSDDLAKSLNAIRKLEDMGRKAFQDVPALVETFRHFLPLHVFLAEQLLVVSSQRSLGVAKNDVGIEVIDYGLFEDEKLAAVPNIGTTTGQLVVGDANALRLVKKTDSIPAVIGNAFGVRYRVAGPVPGEKIMLAAKVRTPGLRKTTIDGLEQHEEAPVYEEKWSSPKTVGEVSYDGFLFEKDWELVSGTWTIQIYSDDRLLGEHSFNVHAEEEKKNESILGEAEKEMNALSSDDCAKRLNAVRQLEDMGRKAAHAVPVLIRTLRYYSLPHQISFDCGSGKEAPGALAKIGRPAVKPLIGALSDSEMMIREGAKEALWKIGKPASAALVRALEHEKDVDRRLGSADVLGMIKEKRAILPLIHVLMNDPLPIVRGKAAEILGILGARQAARPLSSVIRNKKENWRVRSDALDAFFKISGKKAVQREIDSLGDEKDSSFKSVLAEMMVKAECNRTVEELVAALDDQDSSIRSSAVQGLAVKEEKAALDAMLNALQDADWTVRMTAAEALGKAKRFQAEEAIIRLLNDESFMVQLAAAEALSNFHGEKSANALMRLYETGLSENKRDVKSTALRSLGKIGDKRATDLIMSAVNDMHVRSAATEALGNLKDGKSIVLLIDLMKGKIPGAEHEAKISLGAMGRIAIDPLVQSVRGEEDHGNRLKAMDALMAIGNDVVEPLIKALHDSDPYVRECAVIVLGQLKDGRAVMPLIETLKDSRINSYSTSALGAMGAQAVKPLVDEMHSPDPQYRRHVVEALGKTLSKSAEAALIAACDDGDVNVRSSAAKALGQVNSVKAAPKLIGFLKDKDAWTRRNAVGSLGSIKSKEAVEPLLELLENDQETRSETIASLGHIGDKRATAHIVPFLKDSNQQLRWKAAEALGEIQDERATEPLVESLKTSSLEVKSIIANALRAITKKNFGTDQDAWRQWSRRNQGKRG